MIIFFLQFQLDLWLVGWLYFNLLQPFLNYGYIFPPVSIRFMVGWLRCPTPNHSWTNGLQKLGLAVAHDDDDEDDDGDDDDDDDDGNDANI